MKTPFTCSAQFVKVLIATVLVLSVHIFSVSEAKAQFPDTETYSYGVRTFGKKSNAKGMEIDYTFSHSFNSKLYACLYTHGGLGLDLDTGVYYSCLIGIGPGYTQKLFGKWYGYVQMPIGWGCNGFTDTDELRYTKSGFAMAPSVGVDYIHGKFKTPYHLTPYIGIGFNGYAIKGMFNPGIVLRFGTFYH